MQREHRVTLSCCLIGSVLALTAAPETATSQAAAPASTDGRRAAIGCSTAALGALNVQYMTITEAIEIAAPPGSQAYCRVKGEVRTDGEGAGVNYAGFQISLPKFWNGKFLFLGGGGMDGDLVMRDGAPQQIAKGYATASTNSGHADANGLFAIKSPGVANKPALIDYFYRSRNQVGAAAKNLVLGFYDARKISYSYFLGCSNGGRQALMEASRYPDDYDGIIAGAPWIDPLGTSFWSLKNVRALLGDGFIPQSRRRLIHDKIRGECDAADGVRDGLVQNPARCAFDPDSLVPDVITQAQADAIKTIIAPVRDSGGRFLYPGSPISEFLAAYGPANIPVNQNPEPAPNSTGPLPWGEQPLAIFGGASPLNFFEVYNVINLLGLRDPDNNLNDDAFQNERVVPVKIRKKLYENLELNLPNDPERIANFLKRGRKLIMFHGYSDTVISPYRTILLYQSLAKLRGGYERLRSSARLFMAPDVGHCINGRGPNVFGNTNAPAGYPVDPQHDVLSALEQWVENGRAPDSIIATHYTGDDAATGQINRTMPLCPYPTQARYTGSGDVKVAANWSCRPNDLLLRIGPNGRQAGLGDPNNPPDLTFEAGE